MCDLYSIKLLQQNVVQYLVKAEEHLSGTHLGCKFEGSPKLDGIRTQKRKSKLGARHANLDKNKKVQGNRRDLRRRACWERKKTREMCCPLTTGEI